MSDSDWECDFGPSPASARAAGSAGAVEPVVQSVDPVEPPADSAPASAGAPAAADPEIIVPVATPVRNSVYKRPAEREQAHHDALTKLMRQSKKAKLADKAQEEADQQDLQEQSAADEDEALDKHGWVVEAAFSGRTHNFTAAACQFKKHRWQIRAAVQSAAAAWLESQRAGLHPARR